ncbi:DUF2721 domain-containing protein [Leptospira ilyithenensis]|uniref:DUF2721 domain-containing protein n=1 Tax=Leptospira ilyithenensis TaxID=2484901 RepID=A0A4R9LVR9_9LEPT|nr:DUF2721 domain-containing protein [Leptospira ilyithenensis]TGN16802.1 DUF2721 domain-containing protein [Leptospira ilyithenensis]
MEPLSFNTPGLLFPAISLLMLAYTNRFLGLTSVSRSLLEKYKESKEEVLIRQIMNLRFRISLIRYTQSLGILSLIFCLTSLGFINAYNLFAWILFALALLLMIISLLFSFFEIHLSIRALDMEINAAMDKDTFSKKTDRSESNN